MEKFDHLKNIKNLVSNRLKTVGKKLPKNVTLKDLEILTGILAGKLDLDIDIAINAIESRVDKSCVAASKVTEREGK
jgi:hypothetical protein